MKDYRDKVKFAIAELLFDYFVINDKYMAMQMPDGRYIPERIPVTPMVIYDMLMGEASLGVYQQQYCGILMKWVCLDFDCKEATMLKELTECYVLPVARKLQDNGIRFLAEFSGRRGVHLWILTKGMLTKRQGYTAVERMIGEQRMKIQLDDNFGLDLFPAVARNSGKFGKQVKLPLSVHRKGGRSFFIPNILESEYEEWIHLPKHEDFWNIQWNVLKNYIPNETDEFWTKLDIRPEMDQVELGLLYKREYIVGGHRISLEQISKACEGCSLLHEIMKRAMEGNLRYLDRLVLTGSLGKIRGGELLLDILKLQKNYKADVTRLYLDKLKNKYYPVTMRYLYDLYGAELEERINPEITILEYIANVLGVEGEIREIIVAEKQIKEENCNLFLSIRDKELCYMKYDDEVLSVNDYLEMSGLKQYDFEILEDEFQKILNEDKREVGTVKYTLYERFEEGKTEPRLLVTLPPRDRVLTTALIFELVKRIRSRFYSYSYSLNFWDYGSVFMPWYSSWKRFQQDVGLYLKLDFFREYGFIKLDLSRFYDSIYLHAVYKQMEEVLGADTMEDRSVKNILRYLGGYTEKLMYQIHGSIRGVPQGPAYARVLAEIFLSTVLEEFRRIYGYSGENCRFIRYVDDIYIIFSELDGQELLNHFSEYIQERGLQINTKKTILYQRIGDMQEWEKRRLFEDGEQNYAIKTIQGMELEEDEAKQEKIAEFERYLNRSGQWSIKDANFILNRYLDPIFVDEYLDRYADRLMCQKMGRGSIYKRLYEEMMERDKWLKRLFALSMYREIPLDSLNFKNFINTCYFKASRIRILSKEIRVEFAQWLRALNGMQTEDKGTARAVIQLILGEEIQYGANWDYRD